MALSSMPAKNFFLCFYCVKESVKGKFMPSRPAISIIIPVYNVQNYLGKALNSLRKQTLKNFEAICVNDGSKDKSAEILEKFAKSDSRFKIIHQHNQGPGAARNNGLKAAKGEYIAFLDPDDTLNKKAFETLYNKAKSEDLDILAFDYRTVNEDGKILDNIRIRDRLNLPETFDWKDLPYVFGSLVHMVWNKIYKNDFIAKHGIHFTPCNLAEDCAFTYGATLNAKKMGYIDKIFYNYLQRKDSAVHKVTDKNMCVFDVLEDIKDVVKKSGFEKELSAEYDVFVKNSIPYYYNRIKSRDEYVRLCKERLDKKYYDVAQKEIQDRNYVFNKVLEIVSVLKQNAKLF